LIDDEQCGFSDVGLRDVLTTTLLDIMTTLPDAVFPRHPAVFGYEGLFLVGVLIDIRISRDRENMTVYSL